MGEKAKVQTLTLEMIRRLLNSSEDLPRELLWEITDTYAKKLHNSGYNVEQVRKIILAGIKGYGAKRSRCKEEGRKLRRTAQESQGARQKNKLVGKATWFKKKRSKEPEELENKREGFGAGSKKRRRQVMQAPPKPPSTVLFVEQTPNGELAD